MKRLSILTFSMAALVMAACNKYFDINTNPNQPTSVTPNLVLPQALTATSFVLNSYNTYGSQLGGNAANAGGYGGFNEYVTYSYTSGSWNMWSPTYDNLEDYQYIIDKTTGDAANIYFNAVATIMRVHAFQLLVDAYNDIPYSHALKGAGELNPPYDKGSDVYAGLAVELDSAMARINRGNAMATKNPIDNYDVVFHGNMSKWMQLANTLKLKLIVRGQNNSGTKVTFANTSFDPNGGAPFLTTDALINPGFTRDINRQNPAWNNWAYSYTGTAGNKAWVPTLWMLSWYDGTNLNDPDRGKAVYYEFGSIPSDEIGNRLGRETVDAPKCPTGGRWYPGTDRTGTSAGNSTGVLKGPNAGYPLMTAAESYFLQAEANVTGIIIPGGSDDVTSFRNGVTASFNFLYTLPDLSVSGSPVADAITYMDTTNVGNYLAHYQSASGNLQKLEAIITQKYIALNYIHSHEGWNEFRRTGYPRVAEGGRTATNTFASIVSNQTFRPDGLPTRVLYPTSEAQYNPANLPSGIDPFTKLIFWAK